MMIHSDDRALVLDRHLRRTAGEKELPPVYTFRIVTRQGVPIWAELNTTLIDWHGRPATLNIIRDITGRKRAEDAIRETNRKLNLLSSVTRHDILNKVTVMSGYLTLARETSDNPVMKEFIGKLEEATRSISDHIEFTRIYQDLGTTEPTWHDIGSVLSALPVPRTITLHPDLENVRVYGDPILKKVFSNLLDNTLRHGEHATTIRVSANDTPRGLVVIWEDDGIGVPIQEKEKIFLQGYGRNTGLGLFLSSEILSITGMTMRETGTPGKGARFEILVPKGVYRFTGSGQT
jgi:signal transduction histidine kinase